MAGWSFKQNAGIVRTSPLYRVVVRVASRDLADLRNAALAIAALRAGG